MALQLTSIDEYIPLCLKQPLLLKSFQQKFTCVELNILPTAYTYDEHALFHHRWLLQIQCFVRSHRSQDRIIKIPPIKATVAHLPNLCTAVYQA